jgi:hypothetical protein
MTDCERELLLAVVKWVLAPFESRQELRKQVICAQAAVEEHERTAQESELKKRIHAACGVEESDLKKRIKALEDGLNLAKGVITDALAGE